MALKKAAPKEPGEPVTETTEVVSQEPAVVVEPVTQEPAAVVTSEQEPEVTQAPEPVVTEEPAPVVEPVTQDPEPEVTEEPVVVTPDPEPEVTDEPAAEVTKEPEVEAPRVSALVEVLSLCDSYLQQPSTGIRIGAREVKELKADGWLEGQIDAKLLKLV